MKKIYKILLLLSILLYSCQVYSQIKQHDQTTFEVIAGASSSDLDIKGGNYNKDPKFGFQLGLFVNQKLFNSEVFQLHTGVSLAKKGGIRNVENVSINEITGQVQREEYKHKIDLNYVQIPVMLGLEKQLNDVWAINAQVGGYAAYGFKGKTKKDGAFITEIGNDSFSEEIYSKTNSFGSGRIKYFDYGLTASVAVIYDIYIFTLGYEYGLYNIADDGTSTIKNRNLILSAGFRF